MRKYVLMSTNAIDGFLTGAFKGLYGMYYQNHENHLGHPAGMHVKWTNYLCNAHIFPTQKAAWKFAEETWGVHFANTSFAVVNVSMISVANSEDIKARVEK